VIIVFGAGTSFWNTWIMIGGSIAGVWGAKDSTNLSSVID